MIEIVNIEIGYSEAILSSESITLSKDSLYVLVGRNGIGKSTFLKTLSGELTLIKGKIKIEGKNINASTPKEIALKTGFVPSNVQRVDYMSAFEYVSLGRSPLLNSFGIIKEADIQVIEESFEALRITHLKDKFVSEISDGERQLLAVAQVLVQETDIILLDEPLAFLDYLNRKLLLESLLNHAWEKGKVIVCSCHDLDVLFDYPMTYLLIDSKTKRISSHEKISKEELIEICFS